ncbi:hypothetical protein QBC46DRAFT_369990 [Diplogelasinospora grovesii]|uniref:Secreted protein n=1 Tax=Diplogelasinospora grovesii TaxID=303347 RepID=A0AAN6SAG6_9PEZI|nr:hypothetical protein QBC46DRAFT_369990 [Diplogelasinospora grovesii]
MVLSFRHVKLVIIFVLPETTMPPTVCPSVIRGWSICRTSQSDTEEIQRVSHQSTRLRSHATRRALFSGSFQYKLGCRSILGPVTYIPHLLQTQCSV